MLRKKRKSSADKAEAAPARSDKEAKESFEIPSVIKTASPEIDEPLRDNYGYPAHVLGQCLQSMPIVVDANPNIPLRHHWQVELACESITMLDNYPLQAIEALHGDQRWDFHRATFARGLVAGLGEWLQSYRVKTATGRPADPLHFGWSEALTIGPGDDNVHGRIAPGIAEWIIAEQIGVRALSLQWHPSVRNIFWDSFGGDHQRRNPIAGAVSKAQEKLKRRYLNKGVVLSDAPGVDWMRPTEYLEIEPDTESNGHGHDATSESSPDAGDDNSAPSSENAGKGPSPERLAAAGIKSTDAHSETEPASPPERTPSQPSRSPAPEEVVSLLAARMGKGGIVTTNEPGSMIQVSQNGPGLVWPRAGHQVAEMMGVSFEAIEQVCVNQLSNSETSSPQVEYRIQKPGRGWGKIRLLTFSSQWLNELFPEGVPEANESIRIRQSNSS